jgi:hypothetical protein
VATKGKRDFIGYVPAILVPARDRTPRRKKIFMIERSKQLLPILMKKDKNIR